MKLFLICLLIVHMVFNCLLAKKKPSLYSFLAFVSANFTAGAVEGYFFIEIMTGGLL